MLNDDIQAIIEEIRNEANDYEQTVQALLAYANHTCWDNASGTMISDSKRSFGRRMTNKDGTEITPDLVVQRTTDYGMVTEAKKSLPREKDYWLKKFKQLESYDGDLVGWFTPNEHIDTADLVLLIHQTRGTAAFKFLEEKIAEGVLSFDNKISVVTFVHSLETQDYINLQKIWGEISLQALAESLENVCAVPLEKIINVYGGDRVKFYDAMPPLPYLLQLLWDNVFNRLKENVEYDEDRKCRPVVTTVDDLALYLQKFFGPAKNQNDSREPMIPKRDWVKKALDILCTARMAERDKSNPNTYTVFFRKKRKDTFEMFVRICHGILNKPKRREKGKQLSLGFENQ